MFAVKNAIVEILLKHKSVEEAAKSLNDEEKEIFIGTFNLMKSKLNGKYDEYTLSGRYDELIKLLNKAIKPAPPLDYSSPEMALPKPVKPWKGAIDRKNKVWDEHEQWRAEGSPGAIVTSAPKATTAADTIKERQVTNKETSTKKSEEDEEKIKQIKEKYKAQEIKQLTDPAAENIKYQKFIDKKNKKIKNKS